MVTGSLETTPLQIDIRFVKAGPQRLHCHLSRTAMAITTRSVAIGFLSALAGVLPSAAQTGFVYSGNGTQVLPTGSYSIVINAGSGVLVINEGSRIGGAINSGNGILEINGSTFGNGVPYGSSNASVLSSAGSAGVIDINGGVIGTIRHLGGLINIRGGQVSSVFNESGIGAPFSPAVVTQGVNVFGAGLTCTFLLYGSDGSDNYGTHWLLGGTLTDSRPLRMRYWNLHVTSAPAGLTLFEMPQWPSAPVISNMVVLAPGKITGAGAARTALHPGLGGRTNAGERRRRARRTRERGYSRSEQALSASLPSGSAAGKPGAMPASRSVEPPTPSIRR